MEWIGNPEYWVALLTLTVLEIVLGIDNIVFIAILTQRLPLARQASARRIGLIAAMVMRIGLLLVIGWQPAAQIAQIVQINERRSGADTGELAVVRSRWANPRGRLRRCVTR